MKYSVIIVLALVGDALAVAQGTADPQRMRVQPDSKPEAYVVEQGTKVPLVLLNSISSKQTAVGDRIYLETIFPVLAKGKIVIPPGSYVSGTVTQVKRPGRIKGKGELYLRFDSLTLPNGVSRDFRARIGGMDGGGVNELDRTEGKIKGGGGKAQDAREIAQAAEMGTMVGGVAGAAAGRPGTGLAAGAGAGAAAGIMGVLLTRGPDVVLAKGTTVEMVLDRTLQFNDSEVDFRTAAAAPPSPPIAAPAQQEEKRARPSGSWPFPL